MIGRDMRPVEARPPFAEGLQKLIPWPHKTFAGAILERFRDRTGEGFLPMRRLRQFAGLTLAAAVTAGAGRASAQDRSDENAITQAEDAFGFSVGRETLGIYNSGNARGFSPTAAGNVRIDG